MHQYIVYVDGVEQRESIAADCHDKAMMIARVKYPYGHVKVYESVMG